MFEESLLESAHLIRTQSRWPAFASAALQATIAAAIITIPLLRPGVLPLATSALELTAPSLVPRTPPPIQRVRMDNVSSTSIPTPTVERLATATLTNTHQGVDPTGFSSDPLPTGTGVMSNGSNPLAAIASTPSTSPHVIIATKPGLVKISQGVSEGMLIAPIQPIYPAIAKATHTQGIVTIHAIISKEGRIESANVVSGPQLLQGAALDAVRAAHYKPYRLNGEPTEVETTFSIHFTMS